MSILAIVVLVQAALHLSVAVLHRRQWLAYIEAKEAAWAAERKDLLDRIQAPSFGEYAGKVIREKRAERPPDEQQKPPEFIS